MITEVSNSAKPDTECSKKTHVQTFFYVSKEHRKIPKNEGKNDRVPTFFYVKIFRWTQLMCKEIFG